SALLIKQHLRIKRFYGTSENAVKSQIWIAVSVYVLVAIVRKRLRLEGSLYTLLQVVSVTVCEKIPIQSALLATPDRSDHAEGDCPEIGGMTTRAIRSAGHVADGGIADAVGFGAGWNRG